MSDLISRQAAIEALEREKTYCTAYHGGYTQTDYFKQYNMGLTDGIKALNKLPSADPERKVGKWIKPDGSLWSIANCSECGEMCVLGEMAKFCPFCGATMVGTITKKRGRRG